MENLTYSKIGDYNIPNLVLPAEEKDLSFGKYGRMRERYLKENRRVVYINFLTSCKLKEHLHEVDVQCNEMIAQIVSDLAAKNNVNEQLKETNQMQWVSLMNSLKSAAEEIVLKSIIYI